MKIFNNKYLNEIEDLKETNESLLNENKYLKKDYSLLKHENNILDARYKNRSFELEELKKKFLTLEMFIVANPDIRNKNNLSPTETEIYNKYIEFMSKRDIDKNLETFSKYVSLKIERIRVHISNLKKKKYYITFIE